MPKIRSILIGLTFWTAYNFLNAGILAIQENMTYSHAWVSTAVANYALAVMSIGLWHFCQKLPFGKSKILAFLGIHIFASLFFSALWIAACFSIHMLYVPETAHQYMINIGVYHWQFLDGVTKYGFIVGIFYTINFYKKFKEKELRETELGLLAKNMELQNLKSQINPHFLFNALNSVNALMAKDPEKARTMNSKLAQLLRISLDGYDKGFVTLKEELDFIHDYLDIEKVRFGKKLKISEEIESTALQSEVPSMLLQPIVENAIKHGISGQANGGNLNIRISQENGVMNFEIANTGSTLQESNLSKILEKGIGLRNSNARLKRLYGDAYGLNLKSSPPDLFSVAFKIPQRSSKRSRSDEA